jgi:hypothetical protein
MNRVRGTRTIDFRQRVKGASNPALAVAFRPSIRLSLAPRWFQLAVFWSTISQPLILNG